MKEKDDTKKQLAIFARLQHAQANAASFKGMGIAEAKGPRSELLAALDVVARGKKRRNAAAAAAAQKPGESAGGQADSTPSARAANSTARSTAQPAVKARITLRDVLSHFEDHPKFGRSYHLFRSAGLNLDPKYNAERR
jgi:hypothetical protein